MVDYCHCRSCFAMHSRSESVGASNLDPDSVFTTKFWPLLLLQRVLSGNWSAELYFGFLDHCHANIPDSKAAAIAKIQDLHFVHLRSCRLVCSLSPISIFFGRSLAKQRMGCSVGLISIIRMVLVAPTAGRKLSAQQAPPFSYTITDCSSLIS